MEILIKKRPLDLKAAYDLLAFNERHYVEPEPEPNPEPTVPDRLLTRDHVQGSRTINPGPRTDNQLQRTNIPRFEKKKTPAVKSWSHR